MFLVRCRTIIMRSTATALPINQLIRSKTKTTTKTTPTLSERSIDFFFRRNLVFTNSITSGIFMGLSEFLVQEHEYDIGVLAERYEWLRIIRMFIVGASLGFMHHYYYIYLDKLMPKVSLRNVFTKISCDQFICAPLTIVAFFYEMGTLEGKDFVQCTHELQNKFLIVYTGDWMFWPPVQFINFYFLPTKYRVVYINAATMIFDIFLAYMKHYKQ